MFPIFRSTFPFSCRKSRCLVGNYRYYNWMHGILKIRQILYPRKTSHVSCGLVSFRLGGGGGPQVPMWVIPSHGQWLIITIPVFLGRRSCMGMAQNYESPQKWFNIKFGHCPFVPHVRASPPVQHCSWDTYLAYNYAMLMWNVNMHRASCSGSGLEVSSPDLQIDMIVHGCCKTTV